MTAWQKLLQSDSHLTTEITAIRQEWHIHHVLPLLGCPVRKVRCFVWEKAPDDAHAMLNEGSQIALHHQPLYVSCWANLKLWCRRNCLTFPACTDNIFILLGVRKNRTRPSRLDFQMPSPDTVLTIDSMAKPTGEQHTRKLPDLSALGK